MSSIPGTSQTRVTTFVAAAHSVSRLGLVRIVEQSGSLTLGGTAASGRECLAALAAKTFDVAVVDLVLDDMTGYELVDELRLRQAMTPVLLISDTTSGELVLKVLKSGVIGYITSDAAPAEIVDAIHHVAQGLPVLGSYVGAVLVPELQRRASAAFRLTEREIAILNELAVGGTAKEIAARMHLAEPTVKNHVAHVYAKLGVRDRGAAVAEGMRQGWLQ